MPSRRVTTTTITAITNGKHVVVLVPVPLHLQIRPRPMLIPPNRIMDHSLFLTSVTRRIPIGTLLTPPVRLTTSNLIEHTAMLRVGLHAHSIISTIQPRNVDVLGHGPINSIRTYLSVQFASQLLHTIINNNLDSPIQGSETAHRTLGSAKHKLNKPRNSPSIPPNRTVSSRGLEKQWILVKIRKIRRWPTHIK